MRTILHPRRPTAGFTLIELMITVAIIGVIAAIAVPSYSSYVQRGRRADARGQLMQAAQFMQRFYAANDSYQATRGGQAVVDAMPTGLKQSPAEGTAVYTLDVGSPSTSAYTLTMAPVNGGPMASDTCGSFTITSTGVKGVSGTRSRDDCWTR